MTDRQASFVELYVRGPIGKLGTAWNATNAARAAGYAWPEKQGPRLLTFAEVACAVREANAIEVAKIRAFYKAKRTTARQRAKEPVNLEVASEACLQAFGASTS